jgi:hypothetical protein
MKDQTGTQAPAQAGIEDFNGIFQEQLRIHVNKARPFLQKYACRSTWAAILPVLLVVINRSASAFSAASQQLMVFETIPY